MEFELSSLLNKKEAIEWSVCLSKFDMLIFFMQYVPSCVPIMCASILNIHCLNFIIKHNVPDC